MKYKLPNNSYHKLRKVLVLGHRLGCQQDFVGAKTSIVQVSFSVLRTLRFIIIFV